jgi:integrase
MGREKKLPDGIVRRGKTYFADFTAGGRRIRKRLSTQLDAAREILNDLRSRADKADFGLTDNNAAIAELKDGFLEGVRQSLEPSTADRYERSLDVILDYLCVTKVRQVTVDGILAFRKQRLDANVSPRTINHDVTILGAMFNWAVKHKKIGSNPLKGFDPLPHKHPKEGRPLTPDEVERLLSKSSQPWRDLWYGYLASGLRKKELASLTFKDVDWHQRELIVRAAHSKNHVPRRIPIDAGAGRSFSVKRRAPRTESPALARRTR